jgi:hypothetical protein
VFSIYSLCSLEARVDESSDVRGHKHMKDKCMGWDIQEMKRQLILQKTGIVANKNEIASMNCKSKCKKR